MNSDAIDFESLKEMFSDRVICHVNTSEIFCMSTVNLPSTEEIKLRTKLQVYYITKISIKQYTLI